MKEYIVKMIVPDDFLPYRIENLLRFGVFDNRTLKEKYEIEFIQLANPEANLGIKSTMISYLIKKLEDE